MEHLMDQTAITYPYATVNELTGETIKTILEDVADNLFNPDPYYQQGGDMVRVGGLRYAIDPTRAAGQAHHAHGRFDGKPIEAGEDVQGRGLGAGRRGSDERRAASRSGTWSRATCARGRSSSRARSICPSCTASRAIRGSHDHPRRPAEATRAIPRTRRSSRSGEVDEATRTRGPARDDVHDRCRRAEARIAPMRR